MRKVLTLEALRPVVEKFKQARRTVVFANGCFDLLHVGHIRYLEGARNLGELLIVGLNSDESVRQLKGPGRPLMAEEDRAEILSAISFVDYIVIFGEPNAERLLLQIQPDIHCKGTDYTLENVPEREVVLSYGGKVAIVGDPKDHSTRDLIRKIRKMSAPDSY
jgi:rfaE bifunctional protein nucleotidyltransferase chain/domain